MQNGIPHGRGLRIVFLVGLSVASLAARPVNGADPVVQASDGVDFARDIRPILANHCWSCHGPDEQSRRAGLRLDHLAGATAKLDSGTAAIDLASPADSELLARITSADDGEIMPPPSFKKPLTPPQVELLKRWVAQGAKFADHWAFIKPVRHPLPPVKATQWPREPLDYFVLNHLEAAGLAPNPTADRETLLRRLTLDLTGVPPTIEELDAFLVDESPAAYERVVDRLLTSPRAAERLALQWLDAARYADTNGYNNDEDRTMWPWRDWVIRAFADNMPYDRFLTEQLAGDLLPTPTLAQQVATGFNRNHVLTTEGGIVDEEYRVEYVADRVQTTSTVFLGLSFQCARCHDHKFDPLTQRDYYRFFAYFNNVSDKVLGYNKGTPAEPFIAAPTAEQQAELSALTAARASLEKQLTAHAAVIQPAVEKWELSLTAEQKQVPTFVGQVLEIGFEEATGDQAHITLPTAPTGTPASPPVTGRVLGKAQWKPGKLGGALEFDGKTFVDCGQLGRFDKGNRVSFGAWIYPTAASPITVLSKMDDAQANRGYDLIIEGGRPAVHLIHRWPDDAVKVIAKQALPLNAWHHVLVTWDGAGPASGLKIFVNGEPQAVEVVADVLKSSIVTEQPLRIGQRSTSLGFQGLIDDVRYFDTELSADEVKRLATGQALATLASIFATPAAERTEKQLERLRAYYLETVDPDQRRWKGELASLAERQKALDAAIPKTMVMVELPQPRQTHLLSRGQYDQPGEKVDAGVPTVLAPYPANAPANRLGLAQWLTAPDHPLTARVAVNRSWSGLFGTGLVETVEDFGTQGAYPSHLELLDYLATDLIARQWDIRSILKTMVMSATYRQASAATPRQMELDPSNKWLGRGSRFRYPAETLRDSALAVSGLLRDRLGGPSVKPYQPAGLWEEVSVERRFKYVPDVGDGAYRRSMYTFWKRTCPPPGMSTLDAPDRETCVVRRARTNTPLQALVLLNDPTYVEAARQLAVRVLDQSGPTPEERLALACRLSLSRKPTAEEQALLLEVLQSATVRFKAEPAAADQLLKVGNAPQTPRLASLDVAAWTTVCNVILNLDEALTRH